MKFRHDYYVYILLCADGSYYTGMTNNIDKRLEEHNYGLIEACYTFSRRPLVLKYCMQYLYVDDAIRREKQIKRWTRKKKEALINEDYDKLIQLSKSTVTLSGLQNSTQQSWFGGAHHDSNTIELVKVSNHDC
jgi:putative endonuclease